MSPQRISDERLANVITYAASDERQGYPVPIKEFLDICTDLRDCRAALVEAREALRAHPLFEDDECDCGFRISAPSLDNHECSDTVWKRLADTALARIEAVLGEGK